MFYESGKSRRCKSGLELTRLSRIVVLVLGYQTKGLRRSNVFRVKKLTYKPCQI